MRISRYASARVWTGALLDPEKLSEQAQFLSSQRTAINPLNGLVYGGPGLAPSDLPPPILATRSPMGWMCASHGNSNPGGPMSLTAGIRVQVEVG